MVSNKMLIVWWAFWIVGSALVLGSWIDFVTVEVGWIGWGVAMVGVVGSRIPALNRNPASEEQPEQSDWPEQPPGEVGDTTDRDDWDDRGR